MWINKKKFSSQEFKGSYERDKAGERVFVLTATVKKRRITFESFQAAKLQGWIKK